MSESTEPTAESLGLTNDFAAQAAGGSSDAFGSLHQRVAPALEAWVRLHARSPAVAPEDVLQEIWSRVFRSLGSFDPSRGSFRRWVFGVASHALIDAFRRLAVREKHEAPSPRTGQLEGAPDPATSLSHRVGRREGLTAFLERVASLPDEDQDLVAHIGLEGLTVQEVADRLELTYGATQKRWDRLRAKMRDWTVPEGLFDW